MPFRIRKHEPPVLAFIRISEDEVARARKELEVLPGQKARVVHQLRKRCKRLRGLIALYRYLLGTEGREADRMIRDCARSLADIRSADVFGRLAEDLELNPPTFKPENEDLTHPVIVRCVDQLEVAVHRCHRTIKPKPRRELIRGMTRIIHRSNRLKKTAEQKPSVTHLHRWRTWAKRYWYAVRLTQDLSTTPVRRLRRNLARIGEDLGTHHDLSLLMEEIRSYPSSELATHRPEIHRKLSRLTKRVFRLGKRTHPKSPLIFSRRLLGGLRKRDCRKAFPPRPTPTPGSG
jgi:CHAD domain-containing protein